jgi:hypothetical protein
MGDDVGSLHEERNGVNDSGYQLHKLYRLIKIQTIHSFLRIEQLIGVVGHLVF